MRFLLLIILSICPAFAAHGSTCQYWQPWEKLVSPFPLKSYLDTVNDFQNTTAKFVPPPKSAKEFKNRQLCRQFFYKEKTLHKHYFFNSKACTLKAKTFGHGYVSAESTPYNGNHLNEIKGEFATGSIATPTAVKFIQGQIALQTQGYDKWEEAFPNYVAANKKYSELIFDSKPSFKGETTHITLGAGWLPQKMWRTKSNWAQYLLRLATLFEISARLVDTKGNTLINGDLESVSTSVKASYHASDKGIAFVSPDSKKIVGYFDPSKPQDTKLKFIIDVLVRYAGLQIFAGGITLDINVGITKDTAKLDIKFAKVETVSVTGNYRGLGSKGFNKTIKELVEDEIKKNVDMLTTGNKGKGMQVSVGLSNTIVSFNASLESPLNSAKFLRPDHEVSLDYVSPKKGVDREFDDWTLSVIRALYADLDLFKKAKCSSAKL